MLEQGKTRKEQQKQSDELTASLIPHPLCCSMGEEVEELEKGVREGQGVF